MISKETKNLLRQKYIENGCWGKETFGKMLERLSKEYGEKNALKDGCLQVSFKEWDELANRCADYFFKEGLKNGDKVIIQLPNSVVFFVICFAMFKMGVVPVLALPAHREREISTFIQETNAKAYILTEKHLGYSYKQMAEKCVQNTQCKLYFENDLLQIISQNKDKIKYKEEGVYSYETAVLLVSGGTTGVPKLIPRTHADYIYDASTFAKEVGMDRNTVFLASIPAAHNFTFANPGVIGTALSGGCSVMSRNGSADEILDLIDEEKVTITSMVPSLLGVCAEMAGWDDVERFASLKTVLAGGSVLLEDVLRTAEKNLNCKVRQVFGTAEGLNSITPVTMQANEVAGCQGVPISKYDEVLIVDEEGKELSINEYGEMLIRGPYTIMNYFENPEADKEAFREDGFYRTGDKAYVDDNGCIHVCGRIREQINKAGEKISPYELETIIKKHERILDVAVVGVPDKITVNKICACIVTENGSVGAVELREYMLKHDIATYKLPDYVLEIDAIPLTAVGKPDKKKLLGMFNERCLKANVQ